MAKIELLDEQPLNITMSEPQTINETITPQENINVETTDGWYEKSYTETDPVYSSSAASTITTSDITNWNNKSDFSGDYDDLTNKPTIPSKTSDLTNDSGFLTEHQDISGKVDKEVGKVLSSNDFTDAYKSNVDSNTSARHTHSNKSVLDDISSSDVSNWDSKQETLVSGTNIKTINNESILGSGNITIQSGTGDMLKSVYDTDDDGIVDNAEKVNNHTVEKDVPSNAVFTDTTYESKTASSGGTDVSLVTTGEKYTWNNKSDFSGSYNDLSNKPTIPSEVTETTVSNWGFTKNTGTYSKPSGGIPKTDLASAVQTSLGKADTALQSYTETDPVFSASASASITSSDITSWNSKSEFSGSYTDLTDKPTIPTIGNAKTYYGTSDTSASTAAKVVTCSDFVLETGATVFVKFTNANSYNGTATLNVNSTGAKNICSVGTTVTTRYYWKAGEVVGFVYDGTNYVMIEKAPATTTYYGITKLSSSTSSTSEALAATPKAVKTAYDLADSKQDEITSTNKLDYSLIDNTPTIPTVPTNLSSFTDDLGSSPTHTHGQYLTSHQDISGKVDKETGKGLSSNDFTTTYKNNVDSNTSARHTHSNKTVLDGISSSDITNWNNKSTFSGDYDDLTNKPTIPTKTSDITNDSNFITATNYASNQTGGTIKTDTSTYGTSMYSGYLTGSTRTYEQYNNAANALFVSKGTLENVITGKQLASTSAIPTKVSDLTNDSGFIDSSYHDSSKQDMLISGTNIKTINNTSLLGSGDIGFETIQEISGESSIRISNLDAGIYKIYGGVYGCDVYYNSNDSLSVYGFYAYLIVTVDYDLYTVKNWVFIGTGSPEFRYGYSWANGGYCYNVTSKEAQEAITGILSNLTTTAKTNLVSAINELDSDKQETLVSGTNIKTINNQSILGSGNINISGGATKTIMQAVKTSDTTSYSTSYNYFSPFNGDGDASVNISIGSGLTFGKELVTYGDRTNNSVYGVTIGAGISLIKVYYSTRYLNNHTANVGINSNIYRVRSNTADIMYGTSTTMPTNTRATLTGEHYIEVQEGDFIFIGGYRAVKAADVDVISTNNVTSMYVEVIQ